MKNLHSKNRITLAILLIIAGTMAPLTAQNASKEIKKSYQAKNGFTLGIENVYGEINVINWDKNEVAVTVRIETEAKSQSRAEEMLKDIEIDISDKSNAVFFETNIDNSLMNGKKKINVTYEVKTPAYINAILSQKYGNVYIQEISGKTMLEIKYGGLTAGRLSLSDSDEWNILELAYGAADIGYASALAAEIKYSEVNLDESDMLELESAYSKLYLGNVGGLEIESKYDKVNAKELSGFMHVESAYSQVSVDLIRNGFEAIEAEMAYGNFKAGLEDQPSFEINAEVNYGSIKIPDGNYRTEKQGNGEAVAGRVGSNGKSRITAEIKYGNLVLD